MARWRKRGPPGRAAWHAVAVWIVLLLVGLLAAGGVVTLLRRPPAVDVATVRRADVDRVLAATGRVVPHRANRVLPAAPGTIEAVLVDEGDRVDAGDPLARIDDRTARAALEQAQAALRGIVDELAQARRDRSRMEELGEAGVVARQEVERARVAVERLEAARTEARAAVATAETAVEDNVVRAPFAGRILVRNVDPGQRVSPEVPIFEIGDDDPRIEVEVDERYAFELSQGMSAIGAPPAADETLPLTVAEVAPRVDPETGTTRITLALRNEAQAPPIGATVDVNLRVARHDEAVVVPRRAVVVDEAERWVLVVDGRVTARRQVRIIDWPAPFVVVREGLVPGERVILDPRSVAAGETVRPREVDEAP